MLYKEYKKTDTFICAEAVELIDAKTGQEIDKDIYSPELDTLEVIDVSILCGEITLTLSKQK